MAERLTGKIRVDSAAVQGAGSFVLLRALTVAEARAILERKSGETVAIPLAELAQRIIGWDWVDHNGNPLPIPAETPGAIDDLTADEIRFLVTALLTGRNEAETKN